MNENVPEVDKEKTSKVNIGKLQLFLNLLGTGEPLTVSELAEYCKLKRDTVYNYLHCLNIPKSNEQLPGLGNNVYYQAPLYFLIEKSDEANELIKKLRLDRLVKRLRKKEVRKKYGYEERQELRKMIESWINVPFHPNDFEKGDKTFQSIIRELESDAEYKRLLKKKETLKQEYLPIQQKLDAKFLSKLSARIRSIK